MKLLFGSGYLFLLARSLAGRIGVCLATALSEVALLFAFTAFFPVGRALFGTVFASLSFAVVLIFCASITGSLGLFAFCCSALLVSPRLWSLLIYSTTRMCV